MKPPAVVMGVGGHAKVVIDILECNGDVELAGCIGAAGDEPPICGIPVLGHDGVLPRVYARGIRCAFVAIGDNRIRREVTMTLLKMGFTLINAVSQRAIVSSHTVLGRGVAIMPGAIVNADTAIGDGAIINTGATVDHDGNIGAFAHIAPGTNLAGRVTVGEGSLLGIGSCAIPGVRIGSWCVVGAGAAVVEDLPDGCTAIGVPARVRH